MNSFSNIRINFCYRGVVTVDVDLKHMDIDQCPADFYVANAFKNTAHCDFETTYVSIYFYSFGEFFFS